MSTELNVLTLTDIRPAKGAVKKKNRVGRGMASGSGKTANRGNNGEGQRAGRSSKRGFEGGQMPLYRRIPKFRTFPQPNQRIWLELNVGDIEKYLVKGQKALTYRDLKAAGVWPSDCDGVRLLGNGEIAKGVTVQAHYATPSATEKLTAAGGKLDLVTGAVSPLLA
ncbi:MAG: 50S ribosomal protein L15 [Candidatus Melainabacteria bacterium]|nr:50S ribosomal protein L15 [Candidatus Melainabacteria bacterium]